MSHTASPTVRRIGAGMSGLLLGVFSLTLFLSAALMFAIQPMTGKMLLPIVGGTPAGWIVAMAFFQIMLLVGYLLAHILSKFPPRIHAALYISALAAGIYFLPVDIRSHASLIDGNPQPFDIFLLLSSALALPFIALSATSSTIQRLFTTTGHASAADPYFLYVASNIGSFAGLLLYPVFFEPALTLSEQSGYSSMAYTGLIGAGLLCLALSLLGKSTQAEESVASAATRTPVGAKRYLHWMALAFIPSSLLLGVTIYITTDIMSVPMIWVLPLCLYLLTFIIAFAKKSPISLRSMQDLHPAAVLISITLICVTQVSLLIEWVGIFFYLGIFFIIALACHMKLAALRPLDSQSHHLTGFYLMMSVGGALGGVLNAFVIPLVADRLIEFPLILTASLLLHPAFNPRNAYGIITMTALTLTTLTLYSTPPQLSIRPAEATEAIMYLMGTAVICLLMFPGSRRYLRMESLITLSAVMLFIAQFMIQQMDVIYSDRNFYGTIRVSDVTVKKDGKSYDVKIIRHGTTVHGSQVIAPPEYETEKTSYYNTKGPLGDIFAALAPQRVAAIGLGAGVVNCYTAPDRHFTFFEIDPAVVDVAEKYFSFLKSCKSAAEPRMIVGDGRLELNKLKDEKFDLIIVDAFSSDSIPVHLLTLEAAKDYIDRTSEDGIVAFHLSNRYFLLEKQITKIASELGLRQLFKYDRTADMPFRYPSKWMILSRADFSKKLTAENGWAPQPPRDHRVWTDDYSNIMSVIYFTADQRRSGTESPEAQKDNKETTTRE